MKIEHTLVIEGHNFLNPSISVRPDEVLRITFLNDEKVTVVWVNENHRSPESVTVKTVGGSVTHPVESW